MEFVKDFLIYEAGALCGFFIAALMNAARAGQEITIKFEEDKHGTGKEHPDGAGDRTKKVSYCKARRFLQPALPTHSAKPQRRRMLPRRLLIDQVF